MTYRVEGLSPEPFRSLFALSDQALEARAMRRVRATAPGRFPCRVALRDADEGDVLILLNHVSHDAPTPYRAAYAILVGERAGAARFVDEPPPVAECRTLGLRGFDRDGMLRAALLAMPGEADARIRELLEDEAVLSVHLHNAAHGCFLARAERC